MKRKLELIAAAIILFIATAAITAAVHVYRQDREIHHLETTKQQIEQSRTETLDQLKDTEAEKAKTLQEKQEIQQKADDQQKQIDDLNRQLQAKKERQESIAAAAVRNATLTQRAAAEPAPRAAPVAGCGDNFYANYIYTRESGCRTDAVNPGGCRGIGQACPGSKLPCTNYDYACQNAFFTGYAMDRYGSWEAAYNFWLKNHWW